MLIGFYFMSLSIAHKMGLSHKVFNTFCSNIDFNEAVLNMLSFLLFAGALHVNINKLAELADTIAILATIGIVISAAIVAFVSYYILHSCKLMFFLYCLFFGVLISTDPIAVMGILKKVGAPKAIEVKITGESLFNDGVAVVLFIVVLELATGQSEVSMSHILVSFSLKKPSAGTIYTVNNWLYCLFVFKINRWLSGWGLITLALGHGGYSLAQHLHISGPIAICCCGLMIWE